MVNRNIEVFIPTWNSALTISKCIKSVHKTATSPSIILIDRFSTDETCDIAQKFGATIIKENLNLGQARSLICRLAKGEWFLMVDSDVYLHQEWFRRMLRWQESLPNVGALYVEPLPMYEPSRSYVLDINKNKTYPTRNPRRLLTCAVLLRKAAVEGFQCDAPVYEDYLLGKYILQRNYDYYLVEAPAEHEIGQKETLRRNSHWHGAGKRVYENTQLWRMVVALFYMPLKTAPGFRRLVFVGQWNALIGYIFYKRYLELER